MALLQGQKVLVTGASSGIGEAIAVRYAQEGGHLLICGRDSARLNAAKEKCTAAGASKVDIVTFDALDSKDVERAADEIIKTHGGVDVLVNNAGVACRSRANEADPKDWEKMLQVNAYVPMLLTRKFSPLMIANQRGTIVNIGSIAGLESMPTSAGYAASKFALRGFSLSCYESFRDHKVKVCLINPGFVETGMTQGVSNKDRMMRPSDIAEAAMLAFKTSPACVPQEITVRPCVRVLP